jgi:type VI secretion system secreted protein Hcp
MVGHALGVEPQVAGRRRLRRTPFLVLAAVVAVVALSFALIAVRGEGSSGPSSRPVTLDAALAAFGGATDLYLKLPGIEGSSTNARHANEIDVADVSWGLSNASGTPAGATMTDVTLTKGIDAASPKLLGAAAAGTGFFSATITAEKSVSGGAVPLASINLVGVRVVSITQTATRAAGFDEKITLRASVIQLVFTPQRSDGSSGTPISSCWNLATHAAC